MVNTREKYPQIIDLLIEFASKDLRPRNKEGFIRALSVKEAKGIANAMLKAMYDKTPKENDNLRWVIGNAISVVMVSEDIDWILDKIKDESNKISRTHLVRGLAKVKSEKVEETLIGLLNDSEVAAYVVEALGKLKCIKAKEKIRTLENSSDKNIKDQVKKALKRLS